MTNVIDLVRQHVSSSAILGAVGAVLDAHIRGAELDPRLRGRIDELLKALDITDITNRLSVAEAKRVLGEIRFLTFLDAELLSPAGASPVWSHHETDLLQAGADISAGFAETLKQKVVPVLDGLAESLEAPDAAFLDVGVGAAGLSIAMARLWPALNVIGIDPWAPSVALARENVRSAGLTDRVDVRQQSGEDLTDTEAFDLAWIPSAFIPEGALSRVCGRVHRGLRPGQWLVLAMANPGSDPVTASIVRLRTALWGGSVMTSSEMEAMLRQTGYVEIRQLPVPPGSVVGLMAARRKPG